MKWLLLVLAALIALVPTAFAQEEIDFHIDIPQEAAATYTGPEGLAEAIDAEFGEKYRWNLTLTKNYTTAEIRILPGAMDVQRARQVVPSLTFDPAEEFCGKGGLERGPCAYPLFTPIPRVEIWDVDGPVRISNHTMTDDGAIILRLGLVGPVNTTFTLARDITPPEYTIYPKQRISHFDFYQETDTEELALGDLQVRRKGTEEWIENPTTTYHFRQQFPAQGFDPDTEYEQRFIFTDWAENVATTEITTFRTAPKPDYPEPVITPLFPAPNATIPVGTAVVIRARIESPESPIPAHGVRVYYDLKEQIEGFEFVNGELSYTPSAIKEGYHVFSVTATNEAGGTATKRWTFTIGEEEAPAANTPAPGIAALIALLGIAALTLRRREH